MVNMLSPNRHHVNNGNRIKPVADPTNLAVHTEPVASVVIFHAYQNNMEVGTPKMTAEKNGFSFHHSDRNCEFS